MENKSLGGTDVVGDLTKTNAKMVKNVTGTIAVLIVAYGVTDITIAGKDWVRTQTETVQLTVIQRNQATKIITI